MYISKEVLGKSRRFPSNRRTPADDVLTADIRVRMSSKMRACLDLYAEEFGYKTMSSFCRDLIVLHLDSFAEKHDID